MVTKDATINVFRPYEPAYGLHVLLIAQKVMRLLCLCGYLIFLKWNIGLELLAPWQVGTDVNLGPDQTGLPGLRSIDHHHGAIERRHF